MKYKHLLYIFGITVGMVAMTSCKDDDDTTPPPAPNDPEVITHVEIHMTNMMTSEEYHFEWADPDGPGGNPPTVETIDVPVGAYMVMIELYDKSNPNDIEDITEEVEEEGDEHQFFFIPLGSAEAVFSFTYTDQDEDGNPIGLKSMWTFSGPTASAGQLRIVLRHELDKDAPGVADGIITNAGGDTDVDILFPLVVQ